VADNVFFFGCAAGMTGASVTGHVSSVSASELVSWYSINTHHHSLEYMRPSNK
jgi:hypothetical protein